MPRCILILALFAGPLMAFPVPRSAQPVSVAGTSWSGDGIVAHTRYTFNADGSMTYTYNNNTYTKGSWKQDGAKIYWECNNKYCEFEGTIDGKEIRGKVWNVKDFRKELKFSKEGD